LEILISTLKQYWL